MGNVVVKIKKLIKEKNCFIPFIHLLVSSEGSSNQSNVCGFCLSMI